MTMKSRSVKNIGYLLVLVPQILLVVGTNAGLPILSVLFFFIVLPVVRNIVGNDLSPPNKKPTGFLGLYLRSIPRLYFVTWLFVLPWTIWVLSTMPMSIMQYIGFALAFWIVSSMNTAIAHELIHSRSSLDRTLGGLLDASVGYFHFAQEHLTHHARNGYYHDSDAARPGTSVYAFALRRYLRSFTVAWEYENSRLKRTKRSWASNRILHKAVIPPIVATTYYVFAGKTGLGIYLFQVFGAAFTVQVITYLQHWGLTEKETPATADFGYTWDDGCWMQACVTLNHAFHGSHHLRIAPFYEMNQTPGGLTLPASYPVMYIVALFPSYFTKIMKCRLDAWTEKHELGEIFEHTDDCIGAAIKRRKRAAQIAAQSGPESLHH